MDSRSVTAENESQNRINRLASAYYHSEQKQKNEAAADAGIIGDDVSKIKRVGTQ